MRFQQATPWLALGAAALIACSDRSSGQENRGQAQRGPQQTSPAAQASGDERKVGERTSKDAAEAHETAAKEQGQAADAQKDVREKQAQLSEAQQKENRELGEAKEAGSKAEQAGRRAQEGTARAQQDQRAQASAGQQAAPESTVSGQVVRVTQDELVLRRGGGEPDLRLSVGPDTPVLRGGDRTSVTELREGTEVRASYSVEDGGRPVATRIEAGAAK